MTQAEQQIQRELKNLFDLCDVTGDGQVGLRELMQQCRKHKILGAIFNACSKDEGGRSVEQLFREMDRDGSGTIGWEEFYRFFLREIHEEHEKKEVQKAVYSLVLRLLRNNNLERTAASLEREGGVDLEALPSADDMAEKSDVVELFLHKASESQAREQKRFAMLRGELEGQQQRLGDMTSQMAQIRSAALEMSRKADQNAQKRAVLQRLEQEHKQCLEVKRGIDVENDAVSAECEELLRLLAGAEEAEHRLVAELALLTKEAAELRGAHPMSLDERIRHLLLHWQDRGGGAQISQQAFAEMDSGGDNRITWHKHELRLFVTDFLKRVDVPFPQQWSDFVWFEIYRNVDSCGDDALDRTEGAKFCRAVLDAILHHVTDDPHSRAEQWARAYASRSVPITQTPVAYNRKVIVDIRAVAAAEFDQCHQDNLEHRERMVECIEKGMHAPTTLQEYKKCDSDRNGFLSWSNGEVHAFVESAFVEHNLQPPPEQIVYSMYTKFLPMGKTALDAFECVCLADALFRCSFFIHETVPRSPNRKSSTLSSARSTGSGVTPVKRVSTTGKLSEARTTTVGTRPVPKRSATAAPVQAKTVARVQGSDHGLLHSSTMPQTAVKPALRNVVKTVQGVQRVSGVREVGAASRSGTMHTSPPPKQLTRPAAHAHPAYGHD